jgi:hypothetical protein
MPHPETLPTPGTSSLDRSGPTNHSSSRPGTKVDRDAPHRTTKTLDDRSPGTAVEGQAVQDANWHLYAVCLVRGSHRLRGLLSPFALHSRSELVSLQLITGLRRLHRTTRHNSACRDLAQTLMARPAAATPVRVVFLSAGVADACSSAAEVHAPPPPQGAHTAGGSAIRADLYRSDLVGNPLFCALLGRSRSACSRAAGRQSSTA